MSPTELHEPGYSPLPDTGEDGKAMRAQEELEPGAVHTGTRSESQGESRGLRALSTKQRKCCI